MALEPSHPMEPKLHEELRVALNRRLTSTDFFVWIGVEPTGERDRFEDLSSIAEQTESWLRGLDPESDTVPRKVFLDAAAEVEVSAIPKKPSARGTRASEIVGNPAPILAGYVA